MKFFFLKCDPSSIASTDLALNLDEAQHVHEVYLQNFKIKTL